MSKKKSKKHNPPPPHQSLIGGDTLLKRRIKAIGIGIAIIAFWRGAWGLMDVYLFPSNYELSSWLSLLIGLAILRLTHHIVDELI